MCCYHLESSHVVILSCARTRETDPKTCRYQRSCDRSFDRRRRDVADTGMTNDRRGCRHSRSPVIAYCT